MNQSCVNAYTVVYFIVFIIVMTFISKILYESYHRVRMRRERCSRRRHHITTTHKKTKKCKNPGYPQRSTTHFSRPSSLSA